MPVIDFYLLMHMCGLHWEKWKSVTVSFIFYIVLRSGRWDGQCMWLVLDWTEIYPQVLVWEPEWKRSFTRGCKHDIKWFL